MEKKLFVTARWDRSDIERHGRAVGMPFGKDFLRTFV